MAHIAVAPPLPVVKLKPGFKLDKVSEFLAEIQGYSVFAVHWASKEMKRTRHIVDGKEFWTTSPKIWKYAKFYLRRDASESELQRMVNMGQKQIMEAIMAKKKPKRKPRKTY